MNGTVSISVSKDMMIATAYVTGAGPNEITEDVIRGQLGFIGIKAGIDSDAIRAIVAGEVVDRDIIIARGKAAVAGDDAYYDFKFEVDKKDYKPVINEDGSVDYSFRRQLVQAGDLVAVYVPPHPGYFGYTVYANVLAPVPAKDCKPLTLVGIEKKEKEYYATMAGEVVLNEDTLSVIDSLHIDGNASNVMGDIVYKGDIHVKGDVLAGARLISTGSIFVDGDVEAAEIEAGGDIVVKKGIHGKQKALLQTKGSVCAVFIEEATIVAEGDVRFNYSYNSVISAGNEVIADGRFGSIIGGIASAKNKINVQVAGNEAGVATKLEIKAVEGQVPAKANIELSKHLYAGVTLKFGYNEIPGRGELGEYHYVYGSISRFEPGTFVEEEYQPVVEKPRRKTILLVDDEPIIIKTFYTYLKEDYDVLAVTSPKDAFTALDNHHTDLILLDYKMPVMNGGQMLEQIRKLTWKSYHAVPVIFVSAIADKDVVAKILSLYPQGYMVKPIAEAELKEVLARFFANHSQ